MSGIGDGVKKGASAPGERPERGGGRDEPAPTGFDAELRAAGAPPADEAARAESLRRRLIEGGQPMPEKGTLAWALLNPQEGEPRALVTLREAAWRSDRPFSDLVYAFADLGSRVFDIARGAATFGAVGDILRNWLGMPQPEPPSDPHAHVAWNSGRLSFDVAAGFTPAALPEDLETVRLGGARLADAMPWNPRSRDAPTDEAALRAQINGAATGAGTMALGMAGVLGVADALTALKPVMRLNLDDWIYPALDRLPAGPGELRSTLADLQRVGIYWKDPELTGTAAELAERAPARVGKLQEELEDAIAAYRAALRDGDLPASETAGKDAAGLILGLNEASAVLRRAVETAGDGADAAVLRSLEDSIARIERAIGDAARSAAMDIDDVVENFRRQVVDMPLPDELAHIQGRSTPIFGRKGLGDAIEPLAALEELDGDAIRRMADAMREGAGASTAKDVDRYIDSMEAGLRVLSEGLENGSAETRKQILRAVEDVERAFWSRQNDISIRVDRWRARYDAAVTAENPKPGEISKVARKLETAIFAVDRELAQQRALAIALREIIPLTPSDEFAHGVSGGLRRTVGRLTRFAEDMRAKLPDAAHVQAK